jgi:hypothetical protein
VFLVRLLRQAIAIEFDRFSGKFGLVVIKLIKFYYGCSIQIGNFGDRCGRSCFPRTTCFPRLKGWAPLVATLSPTITSSACLPDVQSFIARDRIKSPPSLDLKSDTTWLRRVSCPLILFLNLATGSRDQARGIKKTLPR